MENVDVEESKDKEDRAEKLHHNSPNNKKAGRRSAYLSSSTSTNTNTPEPDVENSIAFSSERRNSLKRQKRYLPYDEPNVVVDNTPLEELMSDTPPLAAFLRSVLVSAVVDEAEKERREAKSVQSTGDKLTMDDLSISSGGSDQYELLDMATPLLRQPRLLDGKCTQSEPCLSDLHGNQDDQRTMSAPVETNMDVANRCTQTEWSWLEDMKKFEDLRLQLESSQINTKDDIKDQNMIENSQTIDGIEIKNYEEEAVDDIFKDPEMEISSESSSGDEEDLLMSLNDQFILPSVGPPKILQYIKESSNPLYDNYDSVQDKTISSGPDKATVVVTVNEDQSLPISRAQHGEDFGEGQINQRSTDEVTDESGEQVTVSTYEHLLQQISVHNEEDEEDVCDKVIDIKPHPPFGTKAARKEAKERAAERAREREIERQKVSGNTVNFYAMTRQMKTLAYSLASTKCMDDGWTVRPLSPSETESDDLMDPFDIKINSSITQQKETFFERFYTNGKRLLVIFPDGTGCCYYPTGNPAVIISSTEKGKYSYIIQEDAHEHNRGHTGILGVFEPTGHGCCYFQTSNIIRMVLTPYGGTYFDNKGVKKKRWWWYNNQNNHVHAPPFQPITFAITKELSMRCMGQDNVIVTYNYGRHTIRFNVGANLKLAKKIDQPLRSEDYEIHLKETKQFVNLVIERIRSTLRFPHSTRINRLPLQKPKGLQKISRRRERKMFEKEDTAAVIVN